MKAVSVSNIWRGKAYQNFVSDKSVIFKYFELNGVAFYDAIDKQTF